MVNLKHLFGGDSRTALIKKNIAGSVLVKGWSCVVQLLLVPVSIGCLGEYEYGIWLTVSAVLLWIDQFDIGLGNGLRNKLAESLAVGDRLRGRKLTSTTFFMLIVLIVPLLVVLTAAIYALDVHALLNVDAAIVPDLKGVMAASVGLVGGTFIFKFIGNMYLGLQLPAINNLLIVAGQTVSLIGISLLALAGDRSLMHVALVYTASPLLVYILSYPISFTRYRYLRPSIRMFDRQELRGLFSLGMKFFVVQVAGLVLFATSNILISRMFSPAEVTPYQVAYRYFSLSVMLFTLISAPLWSATTDAYAQKDWGWISVMMRKMNKVVLAFAGLLVVMAAVAGPVYGIWVGGSVTVSPVLSVLMAVYMAVLIYSTYYSNVLFGIGKIRLITVVTVIEAVIYVPLAVMLGREWGLEGIVSALILVNLMCTVCNKMQFDRLSTGRASGIWNA